MILSDKYSVYKITIFLFIFSLSQLSFAQNNIENYDNKIGMIMKDFNDDMKNMQKIINETEQKLRNIRNFNLNDAINYTESFIDRYYSFYLRIGPESSLQDSISSLIEWSNQQKERIDNNKGMSKRAKDRQKKEWDKVILKIKKRKEKVMKISEDYKSLAPELRSRKLELAEEFIRDQAEDGIKSIDLMIKHLETFNKKIQIYINNNNISPDS